MYTYATYSARPAERSNVVHSSVLHLNHGTVHSILTQWLCNFEWVPSYKMTWMHGLAQAGILSLLSRSADSGLEAQ